MKIILMEEPEIATVGTKGQIVIPQALRRELRIKPKTKLAMYSIAGKLVAARIETPRAGDEIKALFQAFDKRYKRKKRPTEREILDEIQAYRAEKRAIKGA